MRLLILFFIIFLNSTLSATPILVLDENIGKYKLGPYLEILEDKEGQLSIDDVKNKKNKDRWIENKVDIPNYGFTQSAYWVRFKIKNNYNNVHNNLLEVAWAHHDRIEFYFFDNKGKYIKKVTGQSFPFEQRDLRYRHFVFELQTNKQQSNWIYLRFQSLDNLQIPLTLWDTKTFSEKINVEQYILGLFYGMLFIMGLYNLFIYFSLRDVAYLYYVLYISSAIIVFMNYNGLAYEFLWPNSPIWADHSIPVFLESTIFFGILFAQNFLKTAKNTPRLNMILNLCLIWSIVNIAISSINVGSVNNSMAAHVIIFVPTMILILIQCLKKKIRTAIFFSIAWLVFLIGTFVLVLMLENILPTTFITQYSFQMGAVLEMLLLSFGLADRINTLKKEQLETQNIANTNLQNKLNEQKRNVALTQTFQKFVPKAFLRRIAKEGIENIELGKAEYASLSILFSDIRSFATLSEDMTPQQLLNFINAYLIRMNKPIYQHGGFIDKFVGDAIMAVFDIPDATDERIARSSINAGIAMMQTLKEYNNTRDKSGYQAIEIGIGIHWGPVVIGTIGSHDRMDSTVLGDNVNLASRLEGLTKLYGVNIIVSETLINTVGEINYKIRELDFIKVKGRKKAITIFEVYDHEEKDKQQQKNESAIFFHSALFFRKQQKWDDAIRVFKMSLDVFPDDKAALRHIHILEKLKKQDIAKDWDGAVIIE